MTGTQTEQLVRRSTHQKSPSKTKKKEGGAGGEKNPLVNGTTVTETATHSTPTGKTKAGEEDKAAVVVTRTFPSPLERPVHKPQDSLFSASSGWTNYRGFFNLSMLLLVVSNGRVALENLIKYGVLISPLAWFRFFVSDLSALNWPNTFLIAASQLVILAVFFVERLLERGTLTETFAGFFYPALISFHLIAPAGLTLFLQGNPLYSVSALLIIVIEALKIVSYAHVNYWCRLERRKAQEAKTNAKKKDDENAALAQGEKVTAAEALTLYPASLTVWNLYYFMLAPTLCYELKFPLSPRRRKSFLIKRAAELIFLSFLIAALQQQWVVPLLKNSMAPFSEMNVSRMLERLLKLAIPNILIWLLMFYAIFHSALNLLAEILRFADREFYRDFWNAESIQYFWKTWNIPVHRWALRHIFFPMVRNQYSYRSAMIAVFFVSAFFHEYLVSIPLHMFRLWAYYGMMAQIPLSFVTDHVVKGGRAGNIVVWMSLILGQPLSILMYMHDWYIMHYPPEAGKPWTSLFRSTSIDKAATLERLSRIIRQWVDRLVNWLRTPSDGSSPGRPAVEDSYSTTTTTNKKGENGNGMDGGGGEGGKRSKSNSLERHDSSAPEIGVCEAFDEESLIKVIALPPCVDRREWLAQHVLALFHHINQLRGSMSDCCACGSMSYPGTPRAQWTDERGKKHAAYTAAQYIDSALAQCEMHCDDGELFPTKHRQPFPAHFETSCASIIRLLWQCAGHIYEKHWVDIKELGLRPQATLVLWHLGRFSSTFGLLEREEQKILDDVIEKIMPRNTECKN